MASRKRSNKTQQDMLVEHLHANLMLARGNIASPEVATFWTTLTIMLNRSGCKRTVAEWQNIWSQWVQKVKTKARKFKEQTQGTGGGPAVLRPLTDTELKVLEVVGVAAVVGFAKLETSLVANAENEPTTQESGAVPPSPSAVPPPPSPAPLPSSNSVRPARAHPYLAPRRRRQRTRSPRLQASEMLTGSLDRNNDLYRSTITQAAETLAAAIREAGQAIATAILNL